jgi:nucleotide-binding universal stress UspA family protein
VGAEGLAFSTGDLEEELAGRAAAYLESMASRLSGMGIPVTQEVLGGEVGESLCAEAEKGADLVVLATHGRGELARFWLGSVADEVIRHVTRPVLLVHPGEGEADLATPPHLSPVLVSLDGTPHSECILKHAVALAALAPAGELVLFRAIGGVHVGLAVPDTAEARKEAHGLLERVQRMQEQLRHEAKEYLERHAAPLRARGIQARTTVLVEDSPAQAILDEAKALGAGLVAIETHGRGGLSRLFLGSVADKVIRGATVPVLVHRNPC